VKVKPDTSRHPAGCDCGADECPHSGGGFYVLAKRGKETFPIAGPLENSAEALEIMPRAWLFFWKLNPKNPYRWDIVKLMDGPPYPTSLLNEQLGVPEARNGKESG
jgi:hypothetical protein